MTHAQAIREIQRHAGTQFDPDVVTVFCDLYAAERPIADPAIVRGTRDPRSTPAHRRTGHPIHAAS